MNEPSLAPDRRQHSQIDIDRIVSEYSDGACTQRELARRHGVCVGTIQNWLRRHRAGRAAQPSGWVEVIPERPDAVERYRIELPHGRTVVLAANWQPDRVRELIQAVCAA